MTSFNHYAVGAVADWLQRTGGGLAPVEPGYRRLEIRPRPGGGLTHLTTPVAHYPVIKQLLEGGKHVYTERACSPPG